MQEEAQQAIEQIQGIDPKSVTRESALGPFALTEAVQPLQRLVRLFQQIPTAFISELPDQQAAGLRDYAFSVLSQIRELDEFDPKTLESPAARQQQLIDSLTNSYDTIFNGIWHHIGYLSSRQRDFAAMEIEARAAIEAVRRESAALEASLQEKSESAENILNGIKAVAAETGVSQQAIHFSTESGLHETEAEKWQKRTLIVVGIIIVYGIAALFLHKIPIIAPANVYESVQLTVSKLAIFAVLFYALTLSAKNFLAHKHSQVVNKHRQNALATYKAIADAAHDTAGRDIVLSHAADCIFSPQDTGYLPNRRAEASAEGAPILQLLPRVQPGGAG